MKEAKLCSPNEVPECRLHPDTQVLMWIYMSPPKVDQGFQVLPGVYEELALARAQTVITADDRR